MAGGTTALRQAQLGKESTWGTSVAATGRVMGLTDVKIKPDVINETKRYLDGSASPASAARKSKESGLATLDGDVTTEDFIYVLLCGIKAGVTGVGAGSNKLWSFPFPVTQTAVESRTVEVHDGNQEWELSGGVVSAFSISSEIPDLITYTSAWVGKQATPSTLTPALSNRTYHTIPATNTSFYVDAIGGTMGTTQKADTLISWKLDYTTNVHLKTFQNGSVLPSAIGYGVADILLTLVLEANANGQALAAAYQAATSNLIRLKAIGDLITGAEYHHLNVEAPFAPQDMDPLWGDRDGNTTITLKYVPFNDPTYGSYGKIDVQSVQTAVVM